MHGTFDPHERPRHGRPAISLECRFRSFNLFFAIAVAVCPSGEERLSSNARFEGKLPLIRLFRRFFYDGNSSLYSSRCVPFSPEKGARLRLPLFGRVLPGISIPASQAWFRCRTPPNSLATAGTTCCGLTLPRKLPSAFPFYGFPAR